MRVLFLTHRLPWAPNRGDRIRAWHLLRHLTTFAAVDLVSLVHDDEEASHVGDLTALAATTTPVRVTRLRNLARGALALPTRRPLTHALLDGPDLGPAVARVTAAHRPDVVLAYCSGMARLALAPPLRDRPLVLDMVDVDSEKWADLATRSAPPRRWVFAREARCLSRFEADATRHARVTTVVTARERDALAALAPGARIEVVANGVDVAGFRPPGPPADAPVVVFCGVMDYAPNEAGATWMAREVWPRVRAARPDARLQLVGSSPSRAVQALADTAAGIEVTGRVPHVGERLWAAAVATAPLLTARGVQNKVLEAVAAGLPTVVTPAVAAGLPDAVTPACLEAAGPEAFANAVVDLLGRSPDARRRLASGADLEELTWERALAPLQRILADAAG
ncbi:MAG: TIGR03087 family PEP-CTERM/XrtA system glycosyltransferase [Vicinamibacterales bacterium]